MPERRQEHEPYFRAIEETFIRLRGAPLLLSPEDWRLARSWHERGIPLGLVERTLEEIFERRQRRDGDRRVQSLRYCAPAVERAWKSAAEWAGTGRREEPEPLDVRGRLARLADSLPPGYVALAERVRSLDGDAEEVERALEALDREMVATARETLSTAERDELASRARQKTGELLSRLAEAEHAETLEVLELRLLRTSLELPVLSLFSAAARES